MFYVLKKKRIFFLTSIAVCGLLLLAVFSYGNSSELAVVSSSAVSDKVILIDPGHGGADSGATANDVVEKELNLQIAIKLKDCIEKKGGVAVLTRNEDVSLQNENDGSGVSAKRSDLKNRKNMVDECKADMFVSIHINKFEQEKYKGAQVFYADKSEESRKLGETIQTSLRENLDSENKRVAKNAANDIFVLKNVTVPSVLVECGFLSNAEEAKKLSDNEYQQKIAEAIYKGITDYSFDNGQSPS